MYKDKFFREWNGPFPFTATEVAKAPAASGVYQLLFQGSVVYIGISTASIRNRLVKHVSGHGNWAAARRTVPTGYTFVYFLCDPQTARQIESHVITTNKPPFNVQPEYKNFITNITVH